MKEENSIKNKLELIERTKLTAKNACDEILGTSYFREIVFEYAFGSVNVQSVKDAFGFDRNVVVREIGKFTDYYLGLLCEKYPEQLEIWLEDIIPDTIYRQHEGISHPMELKGRLLVHMIEFAIGYFDVIRESIILRLSDNIDCKTEPGMERDSAMCEDCDYDRIGVCTKFVNPDMCPNALEAYTILDVLSEKTENVPADCPRIQHGSKGGI